MSSISGAEIKRQILMSAGESDVKKRMDANPPGISEGEYIEMGNELERVTKMPGWIIIEAYMLQRMNLIGNLFLPDDKKKDSEGIAKAYVQLMQYIQLMIQRRDEILKKEKEIYETRTVQKNERE